MDLAISSRQEVIESCSNPQNCMGSVLYLELVRTEGSLLLRTEYYLTVSLHHHDVNLNSSAHAFARTSYLRPSNHGRPMNPGQLQTMMKNKVFQFKIRRLLLLSISPHFWSSCRFSRKKSVHFYNGGARSSGPRPNGRPVEGFDGSQHL